MSSTQITVNGGTFDKRPRKKNRTKEEIAAEKKEKELRRTKKQRERELKKELEEAKKAAKRDKREAAKQLKKSEKEAKKAAKRKKREERTAAKEEIKHIKKENRKLKKELLTRNKMITCLIGKMLTNQHPDGFSIGLLVDTVRKSISATDITIFGTTLGEQEEELEEGGKTYDIEASIRSFVYEMSPSSAQFWYKYGKPTNASIPMGGFVNRPLAIKNKEYNWKVSKPGEGRMTANGRDEWVYVEKFKLLKNGDWNTDKYGPIPSPGYGEDDQRPQGRRGGTTYNE